MIPADVWRDIDGYEERQRAEWERMRELTFWIHVHSMSSKKFKSPQQLRPLPWDAKEEEQDSGSGYKTMIEFLQKLSDRTGVPLEQLKKERGIT